MTINLHIGTSGA